MDDWQLLAEYRDGRSQAAFGEIVRRHLPLVLGVCRRRLRDSALAEDVAQAVFLLLSRRPPARRDGAELTGWLFKTALYACRNATRGKLARQRHESAAAAQAATVESPPTANDAEVMLDEALAELSASDRDVVFLRFYRGMDVAQIADRLGVAPTTTAKRLSRAVERLRRFFADRGSILNMTLAAQQMATLSRESVPPNLAAQIASAVCGTIAPSSVAFSITERMIQMIRRSQIRFAASIGAAALAIGAGGVAFALAFMNAEPPAAQTQNADSAAAAPVEPKAVDSRMPVQILQAFASAIRAGDVNAMRSLVHATDNMDKRLLDGACLYVESAQALRSAVAKKFGEATAKALAQQSFSPVDNLAQIIEQSADKMEPQIDGDFATLAAPGTEAEPFILERVNGAWRISANRMTETWDEQLAEQRLGMLVGAADAMARASQEVNDGKYATAQEFAAAMQEMFGRR